jgi:hypothetical protein
MKLRDLIDPEKIRDRTRSARDGIAGETLPPKVAEAARIIGEADFGCQTGAVKALMALVLDADSIPGGEGEIRVGTLIETGDKVGLVIEVDNDGDACLINHKGFQHDSFVTSVDSWEYADDAAINKFLRKAGWE